VRDHASSPAPFFAFVDVAVEICRTRRSRKNRQWTRHDYFDTLPYVDDALQSSFTPEIWESEEEKKLTAGDLRRKYIGIAYSRFVRQPPVIVINLDTNWHIELSSRVVKEWRAKSRTRERILSLQLLDTMIEGAKFLRTVKDSKGTCGIDDVSYFENACKINGTLFKIKITTKRTKERCFAYYYSAIESGRA
jgi:hypothetical protein